MGNKLAVVTFGLAGLCASQSWAGSSGPGWASRLNGAQAPAARTYYTYCYASDPPTHTAYFSAVITSAPTDYNTDNLKGKTQQSFDTYLKTRGVRNSGGSCISTTESANGVLGKKQREAELVSEKWKIVETNWTGNQ